MSLSGRIVLLNGAGSSGKTTIASALQAITAGPFLHVPMDAFLDMLPEAYQDHPETFAYRKVSEDPPIMAIDTGPIGERLMRGMRRAIVALAEQGSDLIVDDVLLSEDDKADYASLLSGFEVFRVGVFASLERLEVREQQRGDRFLGLARWQYDRVHADRTYDLQVDTDTSGPEECARRIKRAFGI